MPIEVTVAQKSTPLPPTDPNVVLPPSVRAAADRADAFYKPAEPVTATVTAADPAPAAPAPAPVPTPPPPPPPDYSDPAMPDAQVLPEQWQHRYVSMKGRWQQAQDTIRMLQTQLTEVGDELIRTQQTLQSVPRPQYTAPPPTPVKALITEDDRRDYGDQIIDLAKRAAQEAMGPEVETLRRNNAELEREIRSTKVRSVYEVLDSDVPNWRLINANVRWKNWLRLRDLYSGQVRQSLLDAAHKSGDAPRVVAFFKGFISDEVATGSPDPTLIEQPASPAPLAASPRAPAVALESLAAPGRPRPAGGDVMPADKPVYSRPQIQKFYADVRKGIYAGNEVLKHEIEADMIRAQSEGRIR